MAVGNHPDREDIGLTTRRPLEGSTDLELETERADLAWYSFTRASKVKQGIAKRFPPLGGEAQRYEEHRLEPPNGMGRRQQVVTDLRVVDNNEVNIRKTHDVSVLLGLPNVPPFRCGRTRKPEATGSDDRARGSPPRARCGTSALASTRGRLLQRLVSRPLRCLRLNSSERDSLVTELRNEFE